MMDNRILLCTDLDRTLLPNGDQPESANARQRFAGLTQHPQVDVAYVTGRHHALVLEAIAQYQIPTPDYVVGDVGSSIYEVVDDEWQLWQAWQDNIAQDWLGFSHAELARLFSDFNPLTLQEPDKQNVYKLSYYVAVDADIESLLKDMQDCLKSQDISASLIWSVDEIKHIGLLDVLPKNATKLHAIEFLMGRKGYAHQRTVFAGDSGNDLPVLVSHIQSVLVANARKDVREQALAKARDNHTEAAIYLAKGGLLNMNGNYSAGILEGIVHYIPEAIDWIAV